jgi:hypothetical protein
MSVSSWTQSCNLVKSIASWRHAARLIASIGGAKASARKLGRVATLMVQYRSLCNPASSFTEVELNGSVELCLGNSLGRSGGISEDDGVCWPTSWVTFAEDACNEPPTLLDDDAFLRSDFSVALKVDV